MTALIYAAGNGHKDIVRILLVAGADPSPANNVSSCVYVCVYVCMCLTSFYVPVVSYRMITFP
jgi:hypothetical protein